MAATAAFFVSIFILLAFWSYEKLTVLNSGRQGRAAKHRDIPALRGEKFAGTAPNLLMLADGTHRLCFHNEPTPKNVPKERCFFRLFEPSIIRDPTYPKAILIEQYPGGPWARTSQVSSETIARRNHFARHPVI